DEGDYEIQRLEAEYRRKQEEAKREAARKKAAEEAAKKKAAEEAARKKAEEEAANKKASESTTTNETSSNTSSNTSSGSSTETETGNNNKHGFDEVQETYSVTGWKWPLPARHSVASYFGYRTAPCVGASTDHKGIDIGCSVGSSVVAAAAGRIMYTSKSDARGNYIRVDHGNGFTSLYQHLSGFAGYSAGDYVEAGTVIAYSGMTGICSAPHLHFEIWKNNVPVNPLDYVSP
ncbi:MAG: M23 family metallopeptidase, partial [Eubacterium sp.]|nr:M23 family metallopeptidase [Eubacterium sp.]